MRSQATDATFIQKFWVAFFASIAAASLLGGTVHGFYLDESTIGHRVLWPTTLILIGLTSSITWMITGSLFSGRKKLKIWMAFSVAIFLIYASFVFYSQRFFIVIINYIPPMIALLAISLHRYIQSRSLGFLYTSLGIILSFVAASFQLLKISIDPIYFNHNSTYHLVQAISLWLLYSGSKRILPCTQDFLPPH